MAAVKGHEKLPTEFAGASNDIVVEWGDLKHNVTRLSDDLTDEKIARRNESLTMSLQLADLQIIARENVVEEYKEQISGMAENMTLLQQELEDTRTAHAQEVTDLKAALAASNAKNDDLQLVIAEQEDKMVGAIGKCDNDKQLLFADKNTELFDLQTEVQELRQITAPISGLVTLNVRGQILQVPVDTLTQVRDSRLAQTILSPA